MLFAAIFLKEVIPKKAVLPLIFIIGGASLVVRPWHFDAFNVYSLFVLAQAVLAAAAYTTVSKLTASGKHHQYENRFVFSCLCGCSRCGVDGGGFSLARFS